MQHEAGKDLAVLEREVRSLIVAPACQTYLPIDEHTEILVNPSGQFVEGGPRADTGLTDRKLMVGTYGGLGSHGGGAFSGKNPSNVDRSAAYMARLIARTIVDAGLAAECEVGISYAIGKADPVAFEVDTLGTGEYANHILTAAARDVFVPRPAGITDVLNLRTPRYRDLAVYGHVGRDWPRWEQTWRFERDLRKAWSPTRQQSRATPSRDPATASSEFSCLTRSPPTPPRRALPDAGAYRASIATRQGLRQHSPEVQHRRR